MCNPAVRRVLPSSCVCVSYQVFIPLICDVGNEFVARTLLISTVIVHFSVCAAWSGGLITRSAVVGKVGRLKWTLWTLILRVRCTQIKCAALVQTGNLKSDSSTTQHWGKSSHSLLQHFTPCSSSVKCESSSSECWITRSTSWFDKIFVSCLSLSFLARFKSTVVNVLWVMIHWWNFQHEVRLL